MRLGHAQYFLKKQRYCAQLEVCTMGRPIWIWREPGPFKEVSSTPLLDFGRAKLSIARIFELDGSTTVGPASLKFHILLKKLFIYILYRVFNFLRAIVQTSFDSHLVIGFGKWVL